MEHITDYLNRLFARLPQDEQLQREKQRMLAAAGEEYQKLRALGVSEADAVNRILDSFASIDDLAHQYFSQNAASYDETLPVMERRMAEDYIHAGKASVLFKAAGVGALISILAWISFADVFDAFFASSFIGELFEAAAGFAAILMLIASILCFVYSNKKKHLFDFLNAGYYITPSGRSKIEMFLESGFQQQKALVVGIILCAAAPFISGTLEAIPIMGMEELSGCLLFLMIAAGVFIFVYRAAMNKFQNVCRALLYRALRKNEDSL